MKQLTGRLLIFFLGIPLIVAIIIFLPYRGNAGFAILVIAFSALGGTEAAAFFKEGRSRTGAAWGAVAGGLPPAIEYLAENYLPAGSVLPGAGAQAAMAAFIVAILAVEAFSTAERIPGIIERAVSRSFPLLYPGLLSSFMVAIGGLEGGYAPVFVFIAVTFANDSLAWAFGMLLGKKRNIVPVSPNKSVAGFIGGLAGSMAAAAIARLIAPGALGGGVLAWAAIGFATGVATIIGDLAESALKRSAGVKDSGSIMPGRGGVLDSIDSLLFAAPAFLAAVKVMEALGAR